MILEAERVEREHLADNSAKYRCNDDEIDLVQIFRMLSGQKITILVTMAICLVSALLFLLFTTPLYDIKIQIKSGLKGWPKEDITSWLKERQYVNLFPHPDKDTSKKIGAIRFKHDRKGDIITIHMYWPDPDQGRAFLEELIRRWMDYYLRKFPDDSIILARREIEQKIDELEQQLNTLNKIDVAQLENRISEKTKLIGLKKRDIETLEKEIESKKALLKYFEEIIEKLMVNTDALMKARDALLVKGKQQDLSMLFLLNSIQQNISYADQVKRRMVDVQSNIYQDSNHIISLQNEIEEIQNSISEMKLQKTVELQGKRSFLEKKIGDLRYQLEHIAPIKVLGPATNTLNPVKPRKTLIWFMAVIGGLFLGIFLAFFKVMLQSDLGRK